MKFSIVLALLLGAASLFAADKSDAEKKEAELAATKTELLKAQNETLKAQTEASQAKDENKARTKELAEAKAKLEDQTSQKASEDDVLKKNRTVTITAVGQGVAPLHTSSPAQAYALAKRAAIADAYRVLAEKIKGIRVDGQDLVKNMMMQRSVIRTNVEAMVKNANIVETTFKDGLCEVEMEIVISYSDFSR